MGVNQLGKSTLNKTWENGFHESLMFPQQYSQIEGETEKNDFNI